MKKSTEIHQINISVASVRRIMIEHGTWLNKKSNSDGSSGDNDLSQAEMTAVINKRAGGMGLINSRKAFQKPLKEGIELLHAIQDVYLFKEVTLGSVQK